jgi:DNA polymerase-3 subunit alpha
VNKNTGSPELFHEPVKQFRFPDLDQQPFEDVWDEVELLGFPVGDAFHLVDADLSRFVTAREFENHKGKQVDVLGYFITAKPVQTVKGEQMYFGTFLDSNGDWVDSVHFPNVADRYTLQGNGFYHVQGKVVEEFGVYSIEVSRMQKMGLKTVQEEKIG